MHKELLARPIRQQSLLSPLAVFHESEEGGKRWWWVERPIWHFPDGEGVVGRLGPQDQILLRTRRRVWPSNLHWASRKPTP